MPRPSDPWSIEASSEAFDKTIAEECGGDLESVLYKPKNPPQQQGGGKNVWNKPNPSKMATGQDFFVELRRQVTVLAEKEKTPANATSLPDGIGTNRNQAFPSQKSPQQQTPERAGG